MLFFCLTIALLETSGEVEITLVPSQDILFPNLIFGFYFQVLRSFIGDDKLF